LTDQLLTFSDKGIYCAAGDFYIDPWQPVDKAVITHGHADHATAGCGAYLCHQDSRPILNYRLGGQSKLETVAYGEATTINGLSITLYPAGHIPGSAQVRVEQRDEVWVVSGDYKVHADALTVPYEPVKCHAFITECTFGLPVYQWPDPAAEVQRIREWWQANQAQHKASLLIGYSLGKAQRLLKAIGFRSQHQCAATGLWHSAAGCPKAG
jgi:putative mRNA 3-end processing factor